MNPYQEHCSALRLGKWANLPMRLSWFKTAVISALVALGAFAGPAWAACDINVVVGGSIQNAVDGAVGGQTICVGAGIFNEQVIIQNKGNLAINLQGAGSGLTIITPKATPSAFPSAGGATKTPMMYIYNSNVNVSGFTLDGGASLPADGNGMNTIGVYFLNANGSLRNSVIKGLRCAT